jgi:hypothetical protein
MNEPELRELFRDAPGEPPPARFDLADVESASRHLTRKRRAVVAAATTCVLLAFAATGLLGVWLGPGGGTEGEVPVAASADPTGDPGQPTPSPERLPGIPSDSPAASPMQGGERPGENGPWADSTSGCEKADRELAIALAGELPVAGTGAATAGRVCAGNLRSAALPVDGGTVSVTLAPPGVAMQLATQPPGSAVAEQTAASGGTVWVISTPARGSTSAPVAGDVGEIASALAARF